MKHNLHPVENTFNYMHYYTFCIAKEALIALKSI